MSLSQFECDENEPLIPTYRERWVESTNRTSFNSLNNSSTTDSTDKDRNSLVSNQENNRSTLPNDGNNNSGSSQQIALPVDEQQQDVRVYAERWYILAVFSLLGVLQVTNIT